MANGELTTYLRKLEQFLPSEEAREKLREQLTIGDRICCWICSVPHDASSYPGTSIVCETCLPKLIRKVELTKLVMGGDGYRKSLSELQKNSQPEFIHAANKLIDRLRSRDISIPEMMLDKLEEVEGTNLDEDQKKVHIKDNRLAVVLLKTLNETVKDRDEMLSTDNPYADVSAEDLIGATLEAILSEMLVDKAFCNSVISSMHNRIPDFLTVAFECSGAQTVDVA